MPLPSLHPLPNNPTTGQQPFASLSRGIGGAPPASAAGGGGVHRETLKALQDVMWSDDEVGVVAVRPLGSLEMVAMQGSPGTLLHRVVQLTEWSLTKTRRTIQIVSSAPNRSTSRISTSNPANVVCRWVVPRIASVYLEQVLSRRRSASSATTSFLVPIHAVPDVDGLTTRRRWSSSR
jgi:hypothetical protein